MGQWCSRQSAKNVSILKNSVLPLPLKQLVFLYAVDVQAPVVDMLVKQQVQDAHAFVASTGLTDTTFDWAMAADMADRATFDWAEATRIADRKMQKWTMERVVDWLLLQQGLTRNSKSKLIRY